MFALGYAPISTTPLSALPATFAFRVVGIIGTVIGLAGRVIRGEA